MKKNLLLLFFTFIISTSYSQDKNLYFDYTFNRTTWTFSAYELKSFVPGSSVVPFTYKFIESIPEEFKGQKVVFYYEVTYKDQVIFKHAYTNECPTSGSWRFNLIPNPYSNESTVFRRDWTGGLVRLLADFPKGVHLLKINTFMEYNGKRIKTAYGEINYDNTAESTVDMKKIADDIDKNSTFDPEKELSEWIEKNGGEAAWKASSDKALAESDAQDVSREQKNYYKVIIKNDCNDSKTFVVNDKSTYTINGKDTTTISLMRGTSGNVAINGKVIATVNEKMEGQTVSICK